MSMIDLRLGDCIQLSKELEDNKFSDFLMIVYFRAAKMNISDEDLAAPFLKVSS